MSFSLDIVTHDVDNNSVTHEVVCDQTYNLAPMWLKALPFLLCTADLGGRNCRDLLPNLRAGLLHIIENEDDYRKLNPANGWGDFDGFFEIYLRFVRMAHQYPSGKVVWDG